MTLVDSWRPRLGQLFASEHNMYTIEAPRILRSPQTDGMMPLALGISSTREALRLYRGIEALHRWVQTRASILSESLMAG